MADKNPPIHTVSRDDGKWQNKKEGATRGGPAFETKAEAQKAGRAQAQRDKTEHIIHKKDGTIGERNSYGNDPRRTKG